MEQEKKNSVTVDTTEAAKRPVYSNLAMIRHSETEICLDFALLQAESNIAPAGVRVLTSPIHAKRLLSALAENIAKYEEMFGEIKLYMPEEPRKELVQ